jgi:outer membrane protein assembly factor BamB
MNARVAVGVIAVSLLIGLGALLAMLLTNRPGPTPTATAVAAGATAAAPATLDTSPALDASAVNATVTAALQALEQERYDEVARLTLSAGVEPAVDMLMVARATSNDQRTRHLRVLALDAARAELRWAAGDLTRAGGDSPMLNTPTHTILMDDLTLRAFARADGAEAWTLPMDAGLASCSLRACLQLAGDLVVIVTTDNIVTGVDAATGVPRWRYALAAAPQGFFDLGPVLAVYDEPQPGAGLFRLISPQTGEARDFAPECTEAGTRVGAQPRTSFVRVSNDVFYVFLGRKTLCVQSVDIATLALNWSTPVATEAGDGFNYRGQVGAGALLLPSTTGAGLLRFDAETGQMTSLAPTPDRLLLPLMTREGQVLVRETGAKATSAEALLSLDAATGAVTWRYELGARAPLESTYARSGLLQEGEAVWAWRNDTPGPVVFTVGAGAGNTLTLQVEQLDWATGVATALQSVDIDPPGGDPLVPRLAGWRDRTAWWLFDSQFLIRHPVDEGRADDVWPPRP